MKLSREQRAEAHWQTRERWLCATLRANGRQVYGIPSLSKPDAYHLCDGDGCSCADHRFRGLSGLRIGQAGVHLPCSHILAVQRVLKDAQAAVAEPQRLRGTA